MRFLSVCAGIDAASVAWEPLGMECVAHSEIEKFPAAVTQHHQPHVPQLGDMTKHEEWNIERPDIVVGGTPCQSFSVAGLRKGMADPRGNLALTYLAVADQFRPDWVVWENVPGVLSSNGGRDFGTFLGALGELGYGWAYRILDAQYVRVESHARAVPQRRRRVFVVGHIGGWQRAAAVLFERESMSGHPAPGRKAGQGIAPTISSRPTGGDGLGTDFDCDGGLVFHTLKGEGFDASEDRTGRGTPLVPDVCGALSDGAHNGGGLNGQDAYTGRIIPAIAIQTANTGANGSNISENVTHTLDQASPLAVAFQQNTRDEVRLMDGDGNIAGALAAEPGMKQQNYIHAAMQVRRLTPVECERLQGFPDNYTRIPWRGKPAEQCPDGPRYKALGNSMAVPVMAWIGQRIIHVEEIK